jgi:serine protease Do
MSDERWNSETTDNQFTEPGSSVDNSHIVDVAAEVIDETNETSGTASNPYAEYADAGSATGNGTYHYENTSHEYYQGENYGSSMGGSSDGGSGGRGKGFLAVVLAIVFGVCIGAGFWGVHRYLGSTDVPAETAIAGAAENKDSAVSGEKNAEADTVTEDTQNAAGESGQKSEKDKASADADAAAQEQKNNAAAETQTTPAQQQNETAQQKEAVQQETTASAANTGIENEAGLIIADAETPETELTKVVDTVMPSIVSVYNDFTEEVQTFYGQTFTRQGESTGSGIIIGKTDTELLIVTNNHVVDGADNLRVLFIDQETCDAEIKGTNPSNDLAVIAVALSDIKSTTLDQIKVATLGNSDNLKIGEDVIAIGNALGYGQSVTTGIVSANNREISDETITGTFIQTDAAINPGNSGGALVNINGHVIGINSSKIGGNAVEGMGFAIPISRAIPIIEELMNRETLSKVEESERGTIGISGVTVTSDVAKAYNMPQGVYVAQIIENGGAAKSDLHEGDIITAIDGQTVSSMEELQKQLEYHRAGTEVTLTVQRQDGKGSYAETAVKVTLGTRASIENQGQQESQDDQSQQGGRYDQGRQDGQTEQDQQDGQTEQDQQGGQNGRNGYNDQSEQNGNIQGGQDPFSLFEQFGFPFGF